MTDPLPPSGSIDLDALDDYLMSDHAPDDSMGLSDLDGFLTGIVVGPELILPSEWLPVIWGGEEPQFETEDEMRTVLGAIMGRYDEIAPCSNSGGLCRGMPMEKVDTICLVSCVWPKRVIASLAKELYQSAWFLQARAYAESAGSYWFILSAEYGLVHPDEMIEPYEMTLDTMGAAERRNWSRRVQKQMDKRMPDASRIVVLAGQPYREFLMDYLGKRAATVHVPMAGMRNGAQLSWLGKQSRNGATR